MKKRAVKLLSLILTVCSLFLCVPIFAVAEPATNPGISLSTASGGPGDEVTVDISISGNPGVAYLKLKIDYDEDLSVVKAENKGVLSGTFTTSKTTAVKPYVLQWMGADDSSVDGVIASVTFRISENASVGVKAITVTVDECYNAAFDDVTFEVMNGSVTVSGADDPGNDPASPQISLSSETVKLGENVTLDIDLSGNPGIAYLKLKVNYDDTALALVGTSNSGVLSGTFTTSKTATVKPYVLQWMGADNSTDSGTVATVTFTALREGTTNVTVTVDECYNAEFDDVDITTSPSTVEVTVPGEGPACFASLNLSDNVDIKIYVDGVSSDAERNDYVEYSVDGGKTYSKSYFDEEHFVENGKYGFTVASFSANQLTREVLFRICDDSGCEIKTLSYSVKEYCDYQLENSTEDDMKTLCGALMAYGFFAQLRFPETASEPINITDYASAVSDVAAVTTGELPGYTAIANCASPVTGATASLSLESSTKLNFYLKGVDRVGGITLLVGGMQWSDYKVESVSTADGTLKCCIKINGLNTVDLTKQVMLIAGGTIIQYSPMAYIDYSIRNNTEDINVCKALFLYVKAAKSYFNVS